MSSIIAKLFIYRALPNLVPGHPDHYRIPKKFIFDRNKNLVVTSPGHSQQPVSPQDFFSDGLAGQCHHKICFAWTMPNATTGCFGLWPPFFLGRSFPAKVEVFPAQLAQKLFWCAVNDAGPVQLCHHRICFHQNQLGIVTTGFVFDRAGPAMPPQDFFSP